MTSKGDSEKFRGVDAVSSQEKFDELLRALISLEKTRDLSAPELVLKGRYIQLGTDNDDFSLDDAQLAFERALSVDPDYLPARIELAWYLYAVSNDCARALPHFDRALVELEREMVQVLRGLLGCWEELEEDTNVPERLDRLFDDIRRAALAEVLE